MHNLALGHTCFFFFMNALKSLCKILPNSMCIVTICYRFYKFWRIFCRIQIHTSISTSNVIVISLLFSLLFILFFFFYNYLLCPIKVAKGYVILFLSIQHKERFSKSSLKNSVYSNADLKCLMYTIALK